MSSAIVSRGSKLFSNDEVTPILNTADFWLDMSDSSKFTTLSTTRIDTITDKSVTPKTITKTGDISYDTLRKGIRGSTGASDFLTISLAAPSGATGTETIFVACYTSNSGISSFIGGTGSGTRAYSMSTSGFQYGPYGGTTASTSVAIPSETMVVGCAQLTSSTNVNLYQNGRLVRSATIGANGASATQNIFRSGGVSTFWFRGGIYEMIIFSTALTTTQINIVNHYLMNKWKLITPTTNLISSPLTVSGCTLWLDGNDSSTITYGTGTAVAQWSDKSGNGFHATQATASKRPTYDSTLKGLKFTGANLTCFNTTCPFSPTETIFFVANVDPSTSSNILIGTTNSSFGRYFGIRTGTAVLVSNSTTLYTATYNSLNTTDKYLIHWINDGTNGFFEIGYNTVQDKDSSTSFTYQAGTFNNVIGGTTSTGGGNTYNSYIYEIIIFNSGLSAADRRSICQYLTNKWGITNNAPRTDTYLYPFYNSRPFTRPFNPLDFDGCALWLDGADTSSDSMTLSGSTVTAWKDKSGNGRNASLVSGTPTYSNNSVVFNSATSDFLQTSSSITITQYSTAIFIVANLSPSASPANIYNMFAFPDIAFGAYTGADSIRYIGNVLNGVANNGDTYDIGNNNYYINGTFNTAIANYTTRHMLNCIVQNGGGTTKINISDSKFSRYFYGNVNEVIMYNSITTAQRQQIEGYLAQKWGLVSSLPGPIHPGRLYRSLTTPFDPRQLLGCSLWLDGSDASTVTLSGSNITQWNDKSGNAFNALKNPSFTTATYTTKVNGVNVVSFPTLSQMDIANMTIPNQAKSIFYVVRTSGNLISSTSVDRFCMPITSTTNNALESYFYGGTTSPPYTFASITRRGITDIYTFQSSTFDPTSLFMLSAIAGTSNTVNTGLINGSTTGLTVTVNLAASSFVTTAVTHLIGNAIYTTAWDLGEMIVFNTNVSGSDRQRVEGYLAHKWGLTANLPSTHPFKKIAP